MTDASSFPSVHRSSLWWQIKYVCVRRTAKYTKRENLYPGKKAPHTYKHTHGVKWKAWRIDRRARYPTSPSFFSFIPPLSVQTIETIYLQMLYRTTGGENRKQVLQAKITEIRDVTGPFYMGLFKCNTRRQNKKNCYTLGAVDKMAPSTTSLLSKPFQSGVQKLKFGMLFASFFLDLKTNFYFIFDVFKTKTVWKVF